MSYFTGYRGMVPQWDCDHLGHMNVGHYLRLCGDSAFAFQDALGLTAEDIRSGRGLSFAVVHAESDFLAEVLAGEIITMKTGVLSIGTKSATFHHVMEKSDGSRAFESLFKAVMFNTRTRKSDRVPDDLRAALAAYKVVI